ncbi:MAG: RhuM family protein [Bacilli bacterium]|nr:RhuM family protein [Bacilli bacterium]
MEEKRYEVVKFVNEDLEIDVNINPKEETVWLSIEQISKLYTKDRSVISKHIKNITNDGEVDEKSNVHFLHIASSDKPVKMYSLDFIISIGYRVKSKNGILFRKWANGILREFLLKGYSINENRILVTNDNYVELMNKVNSIDNRVLTLENTISTKALSTERIFYNGEIYDSYSWLQQLFEQANTEMIIIDNFVDRTILDRLVVKKQNVKVIIYTDLQKSHLLGIDIKAFNKQYPTLDVRYTNLFHDRFIIIDRLDLYLVGASLKDAGKKCFAITKIEENAILKNLMKHYNL